MTLKTQVERSLLTKLYGVRALRPLNARAEITEKERMLLCAVAWGHRRKIEFDVYELEYISSRLKTEKILAMPGGERHER